MQITVTGPTFSINSVERSHHMKTAALTAEWRKTTEQLLGDRSMRWRAPGPVGIEVHSWCRVKADRTAYVPAAKAIIDGLTDRFDARYKVRLHTGWWPNDTAEWVVWERHWPPVVEKLPVGLIRLELTVVVL